MSEQQQQRLSRRCCARCGERIRGSVFRMNKRTLCGLCVDDELLAFGYGNPKQLTNQSRYAKV